MGVLAAATAGLRRLLDLLLLALIVVVLLGVLLGKLVPLTGRQAIIVGGSSMEPAIGLGAVVVIRPVPAGALTVGDVVTVRAGDEQALFTHRIIEVVDRPDGRWIRTQGDANADPDPTLVAASAVVGRSELAIPYAGYLLALLSLPTGILFLLGLAATLLAAAWLLESLELDRAGTVTVTRVPGPDRSHGEPLSLRPPALAPIGADPAHVGRRRLSPAEQLAAVRTARQRRIEPALSGSSRRIDRRSR